MLDTVKPKRITLVEGSPTWAVAGKFGKAPHYDASYANDGWSVKWREFGNISYREICDEFNEMQSATLVDFIDLNEDTYKFVPVPGGAFQFDGAEFRDRSKYGNFALIPFSGKRREGYFMPETMLNADKLVNIPAMKMNSAGGTLLFKNYLCFL